MTHQEIARVVHDVIVAILPHVDPVEIRGELSLKDLGADSVERIEIIMGLKQRLSVAAPLGHFSAIENIEALVQFLGEARRT